MTNRNWSLEETMMAFALYLILPPKACDDRGEEVQQFAAAIKRTPSAVALKLWNIAANDENRRNLGKVGMLHGSKLDKEVWRLYHAEGDAFLGKSVALLLDMFTSKVEPLQALAYANVSFPVGKEREVVVAQRVNQQYFRNTLLTNYRGECCITGISLESLLIASHIKPWSISDPATERLTPANGLLLNALHDKAFDAGLITIDASYRIRVSSTVKKNSENTEWLWRFDKEHIVVPKTFPPGKEFIEYHNDVVFMR